MTDQAAVKVRMTAVGVVRDKDGNVKHEVVISADMTPEQVAEFTGKEIQHGSDAPDRDPERHR